MEVPEYQRPSAPNTEQRSSPPSPVIRKHWSGEKGKLELITGSLTKWAARSLLGGRSGSHGLRARSLNRVRQDEIEIRML